MKWCERVGAWEADAVMLEDWDQQAEGYSRPLFWIAIPDRRSPPRARCRCGPGGEVRKMVETLRGEMAAAPKRDWYPVHRDYLDTILSAALSHGEGRK